MEIILVLLVVAHLVIVFFAEGIGAVGLSAIGWFLGLGLIYLFHRLMLR